MKKTIISGWQALRGRGQTEAKAVEEDRYSQIYQEELRYVKQNPEFVAHIFAQDRIAEEERQREDEFAERQERTERLMQSCQKSCAPDVEQQPENDGPELERD